MNRAEVAKLLSDEMLQISAIRTLAKAKHIFTHIEWHMSPYLITCTAQSNRYQWVTLSELENQFMLPTAFRKLITQNVREAVENNE